MSINSSGIVFLDKPPHITSFSTLNYLKRNLGVKKIGHCGTLDPFATGLLIAVSGYMTRLAFLFENLEKEYVADFCFGEETDTLDPEGKTIKNGRVPDLNEIESCIGSFLGEIDQKPPLYSAVKINGKRASDRVRSGENPDLKSRKIFIRNIEILSWDSPYLKVRVKCSKGTYIRSLAGDMGAALFSCAYVTALRRTAVGPFGVEEAVLPENFEKKHLLSPYDLLSRLNSVENLQVNDSLIAYNISKGKKISRELFQGKFEKQDILPVFDGSKKLLCVLEKCETGWKYKMVIPD